jgi:hypothetical protein
MWTPLVVSTTLVALGPSLVSAASGHFAELIARSQIIGRDTDLLASYDYVIVGGGTTGLTVADRLTENSSSGYCSIYLFPRITTRILEPIPRFSLL